MVKSIAVVAGSYILSVVLVMLSNPVLMHLYPGEFEKGHVPSDPALIASTVWFALATILCAWVCARFSPAPAARHILWFFIIGEVMGAAATVANWGKGWPHWYSISWMLIWPVGCWLGLLLSRRGGSDPVAIAR